MGEVNRYRLGDNIVRILKQKKMTQKELAERCGIGERLISKYVCGHHIPSYIVLYRISRALEVTLEDLVEGIEG